MDRFQHRFILLRYFLYRQRQRFGEHIIKVFLRFYSNCFWMLCIFLDCTALSLVFVLVLGIYMYIFPFSLWHCDIVVTPPLSREATSGWLIHRWFWPVFAPHLFGIVSLFCFESHWGCLQTSKTRLSVSFWIWIPAVAIHPIRTTSVWEVQVAYSHKLCVIPGGQNSFVSVFLSVMEMWINTERAWA